MLYVQAYGLSDIATHLATQPDTILQIGSITKQFTAAVIMKLQEQGKVDVDDALHAYLPEYNFPGTITLRMLLTHTSGLADSPRSLSTRAGQSMECRKQPCSSR